MHLELTKKGSRIKIFCPMEGLFTQANGSTYKYQDSQICELLDMIPRRH